VHIKKNTKSINKREAEGVILGFGCYSISEVCSYIKTPSCYQLNSTQNKCKTVFPKHRGNGQVSVVLF